MAGALLEVEQPTGVTFRQGFDLVRIGLLLDHRHRLLQWAQPATVIRSKDDSILTQGIHEKLQRSRVHTGRIDQEMLKQNIRVTLLSLGTLVHPKQLA